MQPRRFLMGSAVVLFLIGPFAVPLHAQQDGVIEDLGTLGGADSYARAVNGSGQAAGESLANATDFRAFVTAGGGMQPIPTLGGASNEAFGINDSGIVVGYSRNAAGQKRAFRYDPAATPPVLDLGDLGGANAEAYGINAAGTIVGYSDTSDGWEGFVWTPAGMQSIGSLGEGLSIAWAINDVGQIVGDVLTPEGTFEAFVHSQGLMERLGTLGGLESAAYAINNAGQVTGWSMIPTFGTRAFRYTPGLGMQELPTLGGTMASGEAIAPDGTIVGTSLNGLNQFRATLWTPGNEVVDLNTRIDPALGWVLTHATGINGNGQIVGFGNINGAVHAFRLTLPAGSAPMPPTVHSIAATPSSLWPANGKMIPVAVTVDASDAAGSPVPCAITGVTSDEPAEGDVVITGPLAVELRAERLGGGDGRIYRIDVACGSSADAMATGLVDVVVPKNQSDDGTGARKGR